MKNKAIDLHNILFAQLERICDEDLKGDELFQEMKRADSLSKLAAQINKNGSLAYNVVKLGIENPDIEFPDMLQTKPKMIEAPRIKK
jgi:hypothetical protein